MSMERRLAELEARAAITELVSRYARGADHRNDHDMMGPLFAADATWSAEGFATLQGRDAIARGLAEIAADQVLWSIHFMVAPIIEMADDARTATCHWYLWELCTMQTESGPQDQWLGAWYESTVALTPEGWRFKTVILDIRVQGEIAPALSFKKPVVS